jgi:hypothetical protein
MANSGRILAKLSVVGLLSRDSAEVYVLSHPYPL